MAKVLYLSYDGMTDPLGESQVVAYLKRLSRIGHHIHLVSYEKPEAQDGKGRIKEILESSKVKWHPLDYSKKPPVLSTVRDIRKGKSLVEKLIKEEGIQIVHCRGYITAMIGLWAKQKWPSVKFIFDMRGWWPDEKVDGGEWGSLYKPVYNYFKGKEKQFFEHSDKVVSLTYVGKNEIVDKFKIKADKVGVIPTCVDFDVFTEYDPKSRTDVRKSLNLNESDFVLLYSGSIGGNYPVRELISLFKKVHELSSNAKLVIVTRANRNEIIEAFQAAGVDQNLIRVFASTYQEVGQFLMAADVGLIFYKINYSVIGRSPTKLGEYWASGIPVLAKKGIGDVEMLLTKYKKSGICSDFDTELESNLTELKSKATPSELRSNAKDYFRIEKGVEFYSQMYTGLLRD
jgi:glycosyltransferase involved in cell wall biosynthesis